MEQRPELPSVFWPWSVSEQELSSSSDGDNEEMPINDNTKVQVSAHRQEVSIAHSVQIKDSNRVWYRNEKAWDLWQMSKIILARS